MDELLRRLLLFDDITYLKDNIIRYGQTYVSGLEYDLPFINGILMAMDIYEAHMESYKIVRYSKRGSRKINVGYNYNDIKQYKNLIKFVKDNTDLQDRDEILSFVKGNIFKTLKLYLELGQPIKTCWIDDIPLEVAIDNDLGNDIIELIIEYGGDYDYKYKFRSYLTTGNLEVFNIYDNPIVRYNLIMRYLNINEIKDHFDNMKRTDIIEFIKYASTLNILKIKDILDSTYNRYIEKYLYLKKVINVNDEVDNIHIILHLLSMNISSRVNMKLIKYYTKSNVINKTKVIKRMSYFDLDEESINYIIEYMLNNNIYIRKHRIYDLIHNPKINTTNKERLKSLMLKQSNIDLPSDIVMEIYKYLN